MADLCPFHGKSNDLEESPQRRPLQDPNSRALTKVPTGKARVQLLYEEYVHLPQLRAVWDNPITGNPFLEPCFAAGCHGIEIGFLLLSEFMNDKRSYVSKRPRIEQVALDIARQCRLLVDVIDGELEEEDCVQSRLSLTQEFPFPDAPPTSPSPGSSPGLKLLTEAVKDKIGSMSQAEKNSLIKVVLNLSAAFSAFDRWSVGIGGIEGQLDELRLAVGLLPDPKPKHTMWLDYEALVKPWVVEQTLTGEMYQHAEDFFFRSIHLGTDCWARVAISRLESARDQVAQGHWNAAAHRAAQASRILSYLGEHVMLLTSMNLRDYLYLKVELEGTSGEGSVQVKAFRKLVTALFTPLAEKVLLQQQGKETTITELNFSTNNDEELLEALMNLYQAPDKAPGLYNYAKALEDLESGLLGGFYYKHFLLATNVIGNDAKGTMKRAVAALKGTYETPVFPLLDKVRSGLGAKVDKELADKKGRMMNQIIDAYLQKPATPEKESFMSVAAKKATSLEEAVVVVSDSPSQSSSGCPFGYHAPSPSPAASASTNNAETATDMGVPLNNSPGDVISAPTTMMMSLKEATVAMAHAASSTSLQTSTKAEDTSKCISNTTYSIEEALKDVYSWEAVPKGFRDEVSARLAQHYKTLNLSLCNVNTKTKPLMFLDHAWGAVSPSALYNGIMDLAALQALGNPSWDILFGKIMPKAARHIQRLLGVDTDNTSSSIHFGHNSHELVLRILSAVLADITKNEGTVRPLKVLTTDTEFYSITRQLNRLAEIGAVQVDVVPAAPANTFQERFREYAQASQGSGVCYDVIYVSQITYLTQETLVPDIASFVHDLEAVYKETTPNSKVPLIVIDGYHGFAAIPTDISAVADKCCYVGGMLKHAGCGANCAFISVPCSLHPRPVVTGWLADPLVLVPGSEGIHIGSQVNYDQGLALQGGTPGYALPLLTFNRLMDMSDGNNEITVEAIHEHVLALHQAFKAGLDSVKHPSINESTLVQQQSTSGKGDLQNQPVSSHTLVFRQKSALEAKNVVEALAHHGIVIDCRKEYVRIGFGANHTFNDVEMLIECLRACCISYQ